MRWWPLFIYVQHCFIIKRRVFKSLKRKVSFWRALYVSRNNAMLSTASSINFYKILHISTHPQMVQTILLTFILQKKTNGIRKHVLTLSEQRFDIQSKHLPQLLDALFSEAKAPKVNWRFYFIYLYQYLTILHLITTTLLNYLSHVKRKLWFSQRYLCGRSQTHQQLSWAWPISQKYLYDGRSLTLFYQSFQGGRRFRLTIAQVLLSSPSWCYRRPCTGIDRPYSFQCFSIVF